MGRARVRNLGSGKKTDALSRRRIVRLALALVGVAVLAGLAVISTKDGEPGSTAVEAWDLPRLGGEGKVRLADFRGAPVVANFFASWCTACEFELPGFSKISRELEGRVVFVGINSLDGGRGLDMARRFDIDWWPLARDIGGGDGSGLHDALGGRGMPITAFYDAGGKLVDFAGGALSEPALRARLRSLYGVEV